MAEHAVAIAGGGSMRSRPVPVMTWVSSRMTRHMTAFRAAALEVTHDPVGLLGRGLYIGVRPGAADDSEGGGT